MRIFIVAALALALSGPAQARGHHVPWCGLYMMKVKGLHDPRLARAAEWARVGSNAGGPVIGAVVVWAHHVGLLVGGPDRIGRWLVHSGNDGNAVRTRWRSIARAFAFRFVP